MTTYKDIEKILIDNGIPFATVKTVGLTSERILRLEVNECGILLEKKRMIVENLLAGENVRISASNETVNISIPFHCSNC